MTIITPLEFELAYYHVAVHHVSHYATGTPTLKMNTNFNWGGYSVEPHSENISYISQR